MIRGYNDGNLAGRWDEGENVIVIVLDGNGLPRIARGILVFDLHRGYCVEYTDNVTGRMVRSGGVYKDSTHVFKLDEERDAYASLRTRLTQARENAEKIMAECAKRIAEIDSL